MNKINSADLTEYLLSEVRRKPGMYLMDAKLISLIKFLTGYRIAIMINIPAKKDRFLENFNDWFLKKKNKDSKQMWYPIILDECENSEETALTKFWEYLRDFDKEIPQVIE
jgi:hypothetical protein